MPRLAVIAGHTLLGTAFAAEAERRELATPHGTIALRDAGEFVYLQRHGFDHYSAPHAIDHRANVAAVAEADCDRIVAIGSAGSLRTEIEVGELVAPDDFISPFVVATSFDDARGHLVPGFGAGWRSEVIDAFSRAGETPRDGGVYWQSPGPRFETPAESRMIAGHAHLVGMTIGSEAAIAGELGLPYAAVCSVDNLANGIEGPTLTLAEYESGKAKTRERMQRALASVIGVLSSKDAGTGQ